MNSKVFDYKPPPSPFEDSSSPKCILDHNESFDSEGNISNSMYMQYEHRDGSPGVEVVEEDKEPDLTSVLGSRNVDDFLKIPVTFPSKKESSDQLSSNYCSLVQQEKGPISTLPNASERAAVGGIYP